MKNSFFSILLVGLLSFPLAAQITLDSTKLDTSTVIGGLDIPWEIQWGPDDWIWFTERIGRVSRVDPESGDREIILDLTNTVVQTGESGLLGLLLHPDFDQIPQVYLVYTYQDAGGITERLVRFDYNGTALENETILIDGIRGNNTHDGSRLLLLSDNTFLMTTGDAQNLAGPQNPDQLHGKTLRVNLDGSIPADNPDPTSYVWSLGHRNAQGLALGTNGIIYSSEHGPSTDDEVNILSEGSNYGWPSVFGYCDTPGEQAACDNIGAANREPIRAWTPTIAVSDLVYYDHPAIPEFRKTLLMTTLKARKVVRLELDANGTTVTGETNFFIDYWGRLRDICVAPDGAIYLASSGWEWANTQPNTHRIVKLVNSDYTSVNPTDPSLENWMQLRPNPSSGLVTLSISNDLRGQQLRVVDLIGREVFNGLVNDLEMQLDGSEWGSGTYVLMLQRENGSQLVEKLILR